MFRDGGENIRGFSVCGSLDSLACVVTVYPKLYVASRRKETFGFFLEYTAAYECRHLLIDGLDKLFHNTEDS